MVIKEMVNQGLKNIRGTIWKENNSDVNNVAEKYILMGFVLIAEQKIRKMKYWHLQKKK